jgi:hypothetical protein
MVWCKEVWWSNAINFQWIEQECTIPVNGIGEARSSGNWLGLRTRENQDRVLGIISHQPHGSGKSMTLHRSSKGRTLPSRAAWFKDSIKSSNTKRGLTTRRRTRHRRIVVEGNGNCEFGQGSTPSCERRTPGFKINTPSRCWNTTTDVHPESTKKTSKWKFLTPTSNLTWLWAAEKKSILALTYQESD